MSGYNDISTDVVSQSKDRLLRERLFNRDSVCFRNVSCRQVKDYIRAQFPFLFIHLEALRKL